MSILVIVSAHSCNYVEAVEAVEVHALTLEVCVEVDGILTNHISCLAIKY